MAAASNFRGSGRRQLTKRIKFMNFYPIPGYFKCYKIPGKILRIMKLVIVIITLGFLQVSASTKAQQVTLNESKSSLKKVFGEVRKQTGYDIFYNSDQVSHTKPVTVHLHNIQLNEALNVILEGQNLSYTIEDKVIVIKETEKKADIVDSKVQVVDSTLYHGNILDENGKPLIGATIHLKGGTNGSVSIDPDGHFGRYGTPKSILVISYVGYITREYSLAKQDPSRDIIIKMARGSSDLKEVIVSTGYQNKDKEYSTGEFQQITAKDLQHSTDPNILKRLDGITTSVQFGHTVDNPFNLANSAAAGFGASPLTSLTIRGQNTLNYAQVNSSNSIDANGQYNTSGQPLIVIDGIASAYNVDAINPEDVESITLLKDAAAASIWGSRAANGVIVIKTKKGKFNQPPSISFSSNINVEGKLDLFYQKLMTTSDFINSQVFAYNQSNMTLPPYSLTQSQRAVQPVFEIMSELQTGQISQAQANAQLDALRGNDVRRDLEKYFERPAITQDYHLGISGGSEKLAYNLSFGYDKNQNNTIHSDGNRANFTYNTTFNISKKLSVSANLTYAQQNNDSQGPRGIIGGSGIYPFYLYDQLASPDGTPLSVEQVGIGGYRPGFESLLTSTYGSKIQSLDYKPLENINTQYTKGKNQVMNGLVNLNYNVTPFLNANVSYDYSLSLIDNTTYMSPDSWYVRNLNDLFTDPNSLTSSFPAGGIYSPNRTKGTSQTGRGQLNFNKSWGKSELTAIAGTDISQTASLLNQITYLGYDPQTLTTAPLLNYTIQKPLLFALSSGQNQESLQQAVQLSPNQFYRVVSRTLSEFANFDYNYDKKYLLSASVRKDGSNAFGIGTNHTGTPYYSFGAGWIISNERFYNFSDLPYLKLRATFGYNGNVNPAVLPVQTLVQYGQQYDPRTNLPIQIPSGATNKDLRPERTGELNLALDFGTKGNRIAGTFAYYRKITTDLETNSGIDPSTGFDYLTYNIANLRSQGLELELHWKNINSANFNWLSSAYVSYNTNVVTKLFIPPSYSVYYQILGLPAYNAGASLSRLYAFKWAGLDPQTGDPRIYGPNKSIVTFNGTDSDFGDPYNALNSISLSDAHYFGSSVPVEYGNFNNTFTYKQFQLSLFIKGEFGYYFRRPLSTLANYSNLFLYAEPSGAEFGNRWKKPGDQLHTNVPSEVFDNIGLRDQIYQFSDVNVQRGDNIRLQEINLSYALSTNSKNFIKSITISGHVSNVGILWRANKIGIDPDAGDYPLPRQYSLGFNAQF